MRGAVVLLTTAVLLLASCRQRTAYFHYEHTPIAGWEKNDTLSFVIGPVKEGGKYQEEIGLRINGAYPFMGLQLVIEQRITSEDKKRTDTLNCTLIDRKGIPQGSGFSHYQYLLPLTTLDIPEGERVYVALRHDMKREILPGIADVGIRLTRQ